MSDEDSDDGEELETKGLKQEAEKDKAPALPPRVVAEQQMLGRVESLIAGEKDAHSKTVRELQWHDIDFDRTKKHGETFIRLMAALRTNTTLQTLSLVSDKSSDKSVIAEKLADDSGLSVFTRSAIKGYLSKYDREQLKQMQHEKEAAVFDRLVGDLLKHNRTITDLDVQLGLPVVHISDALVVNTVRWFFVFLLGLFVLDSVLIWYLQTLLNLSLKRNWMGAKVSLVVDSVLIVCC